MKETSVFLGVAAVFAGALLAEPAASELPGFVGAVAKGAKDVRFDCQGYANLKTGAAREAK